MLGPDERRALEAAFERAREAGDLGPGPVGRHVDHALAMASCVDDVPSCFLDLGSGAGVPGLVLAMVWPHAEGVLLEAQAARAARLQGAVAQLDLTGRCAVLRARAEDAGRQAELRGRFDVVVARGFEGGPPATAECATSFVRVGGVLVVSEPPAPEGARWPEGPLGELGFGPADRLGTESAAFVRIPKRRPEGDRWPRRTGVPRKRPLW